MQSKKKKLLIMDMDGVFLNYIGAFDTHVVSVLKKYATSADEICWGVDTSKYKLYDRYSSLICRACRGVVTHVDIDDIMKMLISSFNPLKVKPYDKMLSVVNDLLKDYEIIFVSARMDKMLSCQLQLYFSTIESYNKEDPRIYEILMDKEEIVFVDDLASDLDRWYIVSKLRNMKHKKVYFFLMKREYDIVNVILRTSSMGQYPVVDEDNIKNKIKEVLR